MSRPTKNPGAAASAAPVAAATDLYALIRDEKRGVIGDAWAGPALVHLDRKITDGLNFVRESIRDLSKDLRDVRSEQTSQESCRQTGAAKSSSG